jgi:G3E family GTPase
VLVNEFGQIGLDAALLGASSTDADGIAIHEVAGGCLCCVNGAPFQVGLARLLRRARPDRLLIEPSGLGHPAQLLQQLQAAPWLGVLSVQPLLLVLDAAALDAGQPLPAAQQDALPLAALLVMNKSETLDADQRAQLAARLPALPLYWTSQGALPLAQLPQCSTSPSSTPASSPAGALPDGPATLPPLWHNPATPITQTQGSTDGWSIGWRWHPAARLDRTRLTAWLHDLDWQRAKLVIHADDDQWYSANLLPGQTPDWQHADWRRDSRLELIFRQPQDEHALRQGIARCLASQP